MRSKMAASSSSRELFAEAVRAALESWPVLQIAVDNGFGGVYGQQKADWMVDVVQQYFHDNADLQQYEVEDFISQLIDQEFNTVVDDGSLPQVCQTLCQLYNQCQQGALAEVRKAVDKLAQRKSLERAKVTAAPTPADQEGEDSEEDSEEEEDMECEAACGSAHKSKPHPPPPPTPEEDEDGWKVVRKKK